MASGASQWISNGSNIYYSAGNVGIGNTSPQYSLDIAANNGRVRIAGTTGYAATDYENNAGSFYVGRESSAGGSFVNGSAAYAGILAVQGDYPLQFTTNNAVRATITGDGKVGIGTTNPLQKFVVNNGTNLNFCVDGNTGYTSVYSLTDAGASNGLRVAGYPLMFTGDGGGGAEAMRVIASGNVGIGTDTPGKKLTVNGYMGFVGNTDTRIYFGDNDYLRFDDATGNGLKFYYDDVERLRINSAGRLIVSGTYAQPQMLVGNDGSNGLFFEADGSSGHYNWKISQQNQLDGGLTFAASSTVGGTIFASPVLSLKQNGCVGIGIVDPSYPVHVYGGAYCTGTTWTNASDARLKRDIQPMNDYGLKEVMELRPVMYYYKSDRTNHKEVGFLAQEVQKIIPEVVSGFEGDIEKGETLGLSYSNLVPVLTKAIQEQQAQIEALKMQNAALVKKTETIDNLKAEVENLKKIITAGELQLSEK